GFDHIEAYMLLYRDYPYFFRVTDPRELGGRVELVNHEAVQIAVLAHKAEHIAESGIPIQSDYCTKFWVGQDVNRQTRVQPVDPEVSATIADLKSHVASLMTWPEKLSPHLVNGFENGLQYQLVDPAADDQQAAPASVGPVKHKLLAAYQHLLAM